MRELAAWAIKTAKAAGADAAKVGINSERFVEIAYRERKPENIKEAAKKRLYIEIFANKRYSGQNTSDLRKMALKTFIENAVATTKLLAEDPFRTLPDSKYYEGRADIDLGQVDPNYSKMTPEKRHEMVKEIESACLTQGGDKVISVTASEYDNQNESFTMTSNGFKRFEEYTVYSAGAQMTAQDEGDRRPNGYHYITTVNLKNMPSTAEIGKKAAEKTLKLLGAKKIKTETLPVIIQNQNVARFLSGFMAGFYGSNIQQKRSFLADKMGQKIASDKLTLIDDPFIKSGLGSRLFDGDGFAAKKRTMLDAGILKEFYVSWYYSRKLGWEPTTGGPSNLIIPPGTRSVEAIMKDLGRGILITGFIGGNSDSTTGDTSVGINGHLFGMVS